MLTDIDRSPPVPTTSSSRPGTEIGLAAASIASAMPETSSTVSPLARSATTKPATWAGVASPAKTWPIAQRACSPVRSWPATSVVRTSGQVCGAAEDCAEDMATMMVGSGRGGHAGAQQ